MSSLPVAPVVPVTPSNPPADGRSSLQCYALVGGAYVSAFAVAALGWLHHVGVALNAWHLGAALAAPLAVATVASRGADDLRHAVARLLATLLALPILVMVAVDAVAPEPGSRVVAPVVAPASPSLDADVLFAGAQAVQEADLRSAGITLMRAASFAARSELRLTRFATPGAAADHVAMMRQAFPTEPFDAAGRRGWVVQHGGPAWVLLEQHGSDVLELRARDRASGLSRLLAQHVPTPVAAPVVAAADGDIVSAHWPWFVGASLAHAVGFVALLAWGAMVFTRVPPAPGILPVSAELLAQRLQSIGGIVREDRVEVDLALGDRRHHRVSLRLDAATHRVEVRERSAVDGDRPTDEDEAEFGDHGEHTADRVWSRSVQATMVDARQLARVPLQLAHDRVLLPAGYAERLDDGRLVTLLCAVCTRSGWSWAPRLFGRS